MGNRTEGIKDFEYSGLSISCREDLLTISFNAGEVSWSSRIYLPENKEKCTELASFLRKVANRINKSSES